MINKNTRIGFYSLPQEIAMEIISYLEPRKIIELYESNLNREKNFHFTKVINVAFIIFQKAANDKNTPNEPPNQILTEAKKILIKNIFDPEENIHPTIVKVILNTTFDNPHPDGSRHELPKNELIAILCSAIENKNKEVIQLCIESNKFKELDTEIVYALYKRVNRSFKRNEPEKREILKKIYANNLKFNYQRLENIFSRDRIKSIVEHIESNEFQLLSTEDVFRLYGIIIERFDPSKLEKLLNKMKNVHTNFAQEFDRISQMSLPNLMRTPSPQPQG
jgi:hypothetical protein